MNTEGDKIKVVRLAQAIDDAGSTDVPRDLRRVVSSGETPKHFPTIENLLSLNLDTTGLFADQDHVESPVEHRTDKPKKKRSLFALNRKKNED